MDAHDRRQLGIVLANIRRLIPGVTARGPLQGEWVLLKSPFFSDEMLFGRLRFFWHQIVFTQDHGSFALIHCRSGEHRGIWLHHLATPMLRAEYLAGSHDIESWA